MTTHVRMIRLAARAILATLFATSIAGAQGSAGTGVVIVVTKLAFPESPLFVNGRLHWVEYSSNRLMRLDGETRTVLHEQDGCGHTGLALTPDRRLILLCYESNEVLYLDLHGKVVERIEADVDGEPFNNPNDIAFTDKGGTYITTSGPFVPEATQIVGRVYFRAPGAAGFVQVADDLHYANGIVVLNGSRTLLVSETNAGRIVGFDITNDGTLSNRRLFTRMSDLVPGPAQPPITLGPDGMRLGPGGNVFVAYYTGGRVVEVSPEGKFLQSFAVPAIGVTNMTFGPDGRSLYVTAVEDVVGPGYLGGIWKITLDGKQAEFGDADSASADHVASH